MKVSVPASLKSMPSCFPRKRGEPLASLTTSPAPSTNRMRTSGSRGMPPTVALVAS